MKAQFSNLFILLLILCGCSNEIAEEVDKIIEEPVPIFITAPRQIDVSTKAVINSFTSENISNIKIYGNKGLESLYPEGLSPIAESSNSLQFATPLVYPTDGSEVTLYSFYPSEVQDKTQVTTGNNIAISLTGQEDLMYASASAGNRANPLPVTLTFNHKLAQIKFKLKNNISETSEQGAVSIVATGPYSGTMDLSNGNLNIASETKRFELPTQKTFDKLEANTEITGELLLFPKSEYSFSLLIGDKYYAVTFDQQTLSTTWNENSIYTLTISINSLSNPLTEPVSKNK